jgi:uncharacterized protein with PQ loop repeat
MNTIGEICGFIAGTIGIATAIPQVARIRKLGHSDGLALSPWLLMLMQFAAWTAYGIRVASPSIMYSNLLTFFTTALVVVAILGNSARNWSLIVLGGLAVAAFVFYGPLAVSNVALIVLTASRLPQLIRTWLNRESAKPTAVSVSSLVVSLTSMGFWLSYAILTGNTLVVFTTLCAISIALFTALLESNIAKRANPVEI